MGIPRWQVDKKKERCVFHRSFLFLARGLTCGDDIGGIGKVEGESHLVITCRLECRDFGVVVNVG